MPNMSEVLYSEPIARCRRKSMAISLCDAPGTFLPRMSAAVTISPPLYELSRRSCGDSSQTQSISTSGTEGKRNDDAVSVG